VVAGRAAGLDRRATRWSCARECKPVDSLAWGDAAWQLRVDLAACYRAVALHGWDDLVFTHISARVPGEDAFLVNPYAWLFEEITASSLIKVDHAGRVLLPTPERVNPAGFVIHSAVHAARPDAHCVLHLHTPHGVAVSIQREGLLPLSQQALVVATSLAYHDYEGIALRDDEKPRLQKDLGDATFLILRNHGTLTLGASVADAFLAMFTLERACQIQVLAQSSGRELVPVPAAIVGGTRAAAAQVLGGLGGGLAWPGLLRKLDRLDPGFRA
jgi:ribulose-5-phosphate 4-epimerase/fuculose-1-phosphate aldolase